MTNKQQTAELVALLSKVTYKPGTEIEVVEDGDSVVFTLHTFYPDATKGGAEVTHVPVTVRFHPPFTGIDFLGYLKDRLRHDVFHRIEKHEADEWFMIDGAAPFHPHPEERP